MGILLRFLFLNIKHTLHSVLVIPNMLFGATATIFRQLDRFSDMYDPNNLYKKL